MHNGDPVVLVGGVRTAIGRFGGAFQGRRRPRARRGLHPRGTRPVGVEPAAVDEVVMGRSARSAPTRTTPAAARSLPGSRPGDGDERQPPLLLGAAGDRGRPPGVLTGQAPVVVAGGDESMSRQPFLDYGARDGSRLGDRALRRRHALARDRPVPRATTMGVTAEIVAARLRRLAEPSRMCSRRAVSSAAAPPTAAGHFAEEIVPVTVPRSQRQSRSAGRASAARHDGGEAGPAAAGLRRRRHGHGGQLVGHQRRRGRRRAHARVEAARRGLRPAPPRSWRSRQRHRARR